MVDKKNKKEYYYGKGGRKTSVAQARIYPKGKGNIEINEKPLADYFPTSDAQAVVTSPLEVTGVKDIDIKVKVKGGGKTGQAEATRHAISRAFLDLDEETYRPLLKAQGFLTRDARKTERKKFGRKKARKSPQWSKR